MIVTHTVTCVDIAFPALLSAAVKGDLSAVSFCYLMNSFFIKMEVEEFLEVCVILHDSSGWCTIPHDPV